MKRPSSCVHQPSLGLAGDADNRDDSGKFRLINALELILTGADLHEFLVYAMPVLALPSDLFSHRDQRTWHGGDGGSWRGGLLAEQVRQEATQEVRRP
ncbi:hypothetical protein GOBAR_DD32852 [Gossypium barbadense]|nr:hypothetical protein GOBAR_DD32852 [Gossypium barbadense]